MDASKTLKDIIETFPRIHPMPPLYNEVHSSLYIRDYIYLHVNSLDKELKEMIRYDCCGCLIGNE